MQLLHLHKKNRENLWSCFSTKTQSVDMCFKTFYTRNFASFCLLVLLGEGSCRQKFLMFMSHRQYPGGIQDYKVTRGFDP